MPPKVAEMSICPAAGFVTFIRFTCQQQMVVAIRILKYQCVRAVVAGPKQSESYLYVANVTTPFNGIWRAETRGHRLPRSVIIAATDTTPMSLRDNSDIGFFASLGR